jgi:Ca2+-binding RTX toxin-like protein
LARGSKKAIYATLFGNLGIARAKFIAAIFTGSTAMWAEARYDLVFGNDGKDSLWGGNDNDYLYGGPNIDSANAGLGADLCNEVETISNCEDTY